MNYHLFKIAKAKIKNKLLFFVGKINFIKKGPKDAIFRQNFKLSIRESPMFDVRFLISVKF